ncbi:MAG TPA: hypothetical protein VMX16_07695 [Terriglobia bacterium]|nr:hypothetical protein [Terriglobia bacterium]
MRLSLGPQSNPKLPRLDHKPPALKVKHGKHPKVGDDGSVAIFLRVMCSQFLETERPMAFKQGLYCAAEIAPSRENFRSGAFEPVHRVFHNFQTMFALFGGFEDLTCEREVNCFHWFRSTTLQKYERSAFHWLHLARRTGEPENIQRSLLLKHFDDCIQK